ncbi:DUF7169 domain-containing protein [Streptomyces niveus]
MDTLERDLTELRQMVTIFEDAATMPGRRRSATDADEGRRATKGPSRPTEDTALDDSRVALQEQMRTGTTYVTQAIALVRGVTASMDRALSQWEGEDEIRTPGGCNEDHDWTPVHT